MREKRPRPVGDLKRGGRGARARPGPVGDLKSGGRGARERPGPVGDLKNGGRGARERPSAKTNCIGEERGWGLLYTAVRSKISALQTKKTNNAHSLFHVSQSI